jgi:CheY-like chemotaxis protein/prolyl-tRNA editing enzyme YbaK/EbsC (Cys-tRNA(Pro) deacylase)
MSLPHWLQKILVRARVPFQEHEHLPVYSANQLAHAEHISGHRVAKPVFLAGGKRPVMVVVPASARVDVARVNAVLGMNDLRVAGEDEMERWFKGCRPGCVPPVRLREDEIILMDRALAQMGTILFAAGSPEHAVSMPFRDWYRMVRPGVGRFTARNVKTRTSKPMVLVVEDEADTNHLLCQLLEKRGFVCRAAVDGQRALSLASELRPSAILLDLMLPDMSGFEMYQRLRQVGPLRLPPAVVVTALEDDGMRRLSYELGADAYLTKPFFPESLMRELDNVLADATA